MHEHSFPDSAEAPDQRTERALEALRYEERIGLGFRRRKRNALGNPYGEPEAYQVDRLLSTGDLWAGYLAGFGLVLGVGAVFYKPLLLGVVAIICLMIGAISNGPASRIAAVGTLVAAIGVTLGMLLAIFWWNSPIW